MPIVHGPPAQTRTDPNKQGARTRTDRTDHDAQTAQTMGKGKFPGRGRTVGGRSGKGRPRGVGRFNWRDWAATGAQVAGSIAQAFAASGSAPATGTSTKNKASNVTYVGHGSSVSAFKHVQRKKPPERFHEEGQFIYWRNLKGNIRPQQGVQSIDSIIGIWENSDMKTIMDADPHFSDPATDSRTNTRDYLLKRAECKTIFSNVGSFTGHITIYNVRAREVQFGPSDQSPAASMGEGADEMEGSAGSRELVWGIEPKDVHRFKEHWEVLNREDFSIGPGEEHCHTFRITANHALTADKWLGFTSGPMPGYSYYIMVRAFGQLVTEDGAATEVTLGNAIINWASYIKYYSKSTPPQTEHTAVFATSAFDTVDVPKIINQDTGTEQGEVTI